MGCSAPEGMRPNVVETVARASLGEEIASEAGHQFEQRAAVAAGIDQPGVAHQVGFGVGPTVPHDAVDGVFGEQRFEDRAGDAELFGGGVAFGPGRRKRLGREDRERVRSAATRRPEL